MDPEGSLLHLQVPATCPYPEPDQSSHCLHIINNILITRHAWEITEMQTEF